MLGPIAYRLSRPTKRRRTRVRFIGSKEMLLHEVAAVLRRSIGEKPARVGDLFTGSASVARLLKSLGHTVVANDNLRLGYVLATATLAVDCEPSFAHLLRARAVVAPTKLLLGTPYDRVLEHLNSLPPEDGFFFREYSPEGAPRDGPPRRYFTHQNARKIDAIRKALREWDRAGLLGEPDLCLLLADLVRATNSVASIAGTYGCFMKHWDPRALRPLVLTRSVITPGSRPHRVYCTDANSLVRKLGFDVVYLDPPYTWRHYGAYYHILETLACQDEPVVSGKTGLRSWGASKSAYCHRQRAATALCDLIGALSARHIILSYSSDGLIPHDVILGALRSRGDPDYTEVAYRRYRSHAGKTRSTVSERIYHVKVETGPRPRHRHDTLLADSAQPGPPATCRQLRRRPWGTGSLRYQKQTQ